MTNELANIHLILSIDEGFTDEYITDLNSVVDNKALNLRLTKRPSGMAFAAAEWIIPTLIVTYIAKPFFEAFLKEAGKDAYLAGKDWVKRAARDAKPIKVSLITASQSTEKLDKSYTQSLSFSAVFQTKDNTLIKAQFDDRLDAVAWEVAIEKMFGHIADHYSNYPNDLITNSLKELTDRPNDTIYALLDIDTQEWVFVNSKMLLTKNRLEQGTKN